jgi:hypothetical protein
MATNNVLIMQPLTGAVASQGGGGNGGAGLGGGGDGGLQRAGDQGNRFPDI